MPAVAAAVVVGHPVLAVADLAHLAHLLVLALAQVVAHPVQQLLLVAALLLLPLARAHLVPVVGALAVLALLVPAAVVVAPLQHLLSRQSC